MAVSVFIFFKIRFDIIPTISFREFFADEVGTTYFVEHLEAILWSFFEYITMWIHFFNHLHYVELDFGEASFFVFGNIDLNATTKFAFRGRIVWFVVDRAEENAWEIECVEVGSERIGVEPRSPNSLEWKRVAYAHIDEIEFAENACNWVVDSRLWVRDVW